MQIRTSEEAVFALVDGLLARWRAEPKKYPYNRPDSIIPQTIIPKEIREDKRLLSNMYLAIDSHMKGRVASLTAFRGHVNIWKKYPWFYEPRIMLWEKESRIVEILAEFLPIDKKNVARDLRINFRHLTQYYNDSALNLIKGVRTYEEAVRRMLNKRTKRELQAAGYAGEGLYGHQEKMVSMLLYFFDWEGWLRPRFIYPSPADFHNFRIGIASKSILIEGTNEDTIRDYELISAPWRKLIMKYLLIRKEDPVDVADVLWLFSKDMCGNSPVTHTPRNEEKNGSGMFDTEELPHSNDIEQFLHPRYRKDLEETCLICPLLSTCDYAIPAKPYYASGHIELRPRPRVEDRIDCSRLREPSYPKLFTHPNLSFEPEQK